MANEMIGYNLRNTGTESQPVWETWFAVTLAEAVKVSADSDQTILEYVNQKISDLIGTAPDTFDTLQEIAEWIADNEEVTEAINQAITNKVDKEEGKGLSSNDFTDEYKQKVDNAATGLLYTNNTPVVQAHGGIAAGETFEDVPITEMLNKILYPWVAPVVSATITAPSNGGVKEKGDTQNVTNIRVNVTKKSSNITKIEVLDGVTPVGTKEGTEVQNGGTFDFACDIDVDTNKGFQVKVTDAATKVTNANTGSFTFV